MAKCKDCGTEYEKDAPICPTCGMNPSVQTLTDLPGADIKGANRELRKGIKETREHREELLEATCRSCGAKVYKELDPCPNCGAAGGAQTITDLPKVHLREAHKKLKEEIREAKRKKSEGDQ